MGGASYLRHCCPAWLQDQLGLAWRSRPLQPPCSAATGCSAPALALMSAPSRSFSGSFRRHSASETWPQLIAPIRARPQNDGVRIRSVQRDGSVDTESGKGLRASLPSVASKPRGDGDEAPHVARGRNCADSRG
jgi:hypothetical protein